MHRPINLPVVLVVALLIAGVQSAPPAPAPLPVEIASLVDRPEAAAAFDYLAFKATGADLRAVSVALNRRALADGGRCLTDGELVAQENLAAAAAADRTAWEADKAAAAEAWVKWEAFLVAMEGGQPATEPPFNSVADRYAQASAATDPRPREVLARTARDQLLRFGQSGGDQVWGALSAGAKARVLARLRRATCAADRDNTTWLKADIAANGWYRLSVSGWPVANSAWLMAQHADRDRAFQRLVLTLMEPLVAEGEAMKSDFAYLFDRVAVGENRPQRYATQGRCTGPGRWEPNTLEDAERVEALRAEAEIEPFAAYQARMNEVCANFAG